MTSRLKLSDSIYILEESGNHYKVIFTSSRKVKRFKVDSLVKDVVGELAEEKTRGGLVSRLEGFYDAETISSCINALENQGIVREYYQGDINERNSGQMAYIDEFTSSWSETKEVQKKIEDSKICVFGVGGIGTWIVNGLYQLGVGEIKISDPGRVSESNLNRQLFFNLSDVGKNKVDVLAEKLPDAQIIPFTKMVSRDEDLEDIVSGSDFLVNCADYPSVATTSEIIDEYAQRHGVPYSVAGGYNMHLGMVGPIIIPGETASFNDFLERQKSNDDLSSLKVVKDISQTGNLGPIAGTIVNLHVMEIFKYLSGLGEININRFAEIDFMNFGVDWRYFSKDK